MSEKQYEVPKGMLKAALNAKEMPDTEPFRRTVLPALEAFRRGEKKGKEQS